MSTIGSDACVRIGVLGLAILLLFSMPTQSSAQENFDKAAIPRPGAERERKEAREREARELARRLAIEAAIAEAEGKPSTPDDEDDETEEDETVESAEGKTTTPAAAPLPGSLPPELQEMLPVGVDFEGVRFPNYNGDRLTQVVNAQKMARIDDEHLDLIDLVIDVMNEVGEIDTKIFMDRAVYDLTERKLTSRAPATIEQKPKFKMTGDKLIYEAETEKGHMIGNVKTYIFNMKKSGTDGILPGAGKAEAEPK